MCLRALGIMLPSPPGSITAIAGRETPHFISPRDNFDSLFERRSRHSVVHTMHESVRLEIMRRIAAGSQPVEQRELSAKAKAEQEAIAKQQVIAKQEVVTKRSSDALGGEQNDGSTNCKKQKQSIPVVASGPRNEAS